MPIQIRNDQMESLLAGSFQRKGDAAAAWGKVGSVIGMLPQLRGFWNFASVNESGDLEEPRGRVMYNRNGVTFGIDSLVPYGIFNHASSQYFSRLADEAGLKITGSLTFGAWVRFDTLLASSRGIGGKYYSVNQKSWMLYKSSAHHMSAVISQDGSTIVSISSTGTVSAATWHFVALRFNAGFNLSVWLDGEQVSLAGAPLNLFDSSELFAFGRANRGSYLNGRLALVWLCADALPDHLVWAVREHTRPLFGV